MKTRTHGSRIDLRFVPRRNRALLTCAALLAMSAMAVLSGPISQASAQPQETGISFDGHLDDWNPGESAVATDRWAFFRYDAEKQSSIQNGPVMTVLQIDLDQDTATGFATPDGSMGVDLEVALTTLDRRDPTKLGGGIEINAYGANDSHEALSHANIGFSCLPTHASKSFELRVSREIQGPDWLESMASAASAFDYRFVHRDANYQSLWTGETRTLALPAKTPGKQVYDAEIPARTEGVLRVVSWNVLWGTPSKTPDGFARVLNAIEPDVILFQEWDHGYWTDKPRMPEREYTDWLNKHLEGSWSIKLGADRGVLVASRSSIMPFLPEQIQVAANPGAGISRARNVRCASGRVMTPLGEVGAVSVHFKSQGGLDSREDRIRQAEVERVHEAIKNALGENMPEFLIIAGDWNLVGGRGPLEYAVSGIDRSGSDLRIVEPRRLGINDVITWRDQRSSFAPGRLDYALIADDGVELVNSFILDTALLSDESLSKSRLLRKDTDGSDHLPMVFDLRRTSSEE